MPNYIVNRNPQPNGDFEVHNKDLNKWCLPAAENRKQLGYFTICGDAVREAKRLGYATADGCAECAPECHNK